MIFYKKQSLENHFLLKQAEQAQEEGLVSEEELLRIRKEHPEQLYSPNFFIRVGLFILTNMASLFSLGFIVAIISTALNDKNYHLIGYFLGIVILGILELMLPNKFYYRSGVDDGLSWMGVSFLAMGFSPLFEHHPIYFFSLLLLLLILSSIRYLNEVLAGATVICIMVLTYYLAADWGGKAMDLLPFIFLMLSSAIVLLVERFRYQPQYRHLDYPLRAIQATSLVLVYVSINYYVVREGSILLMHKNFKPEEQIPLGQLFWLLTFFIPLAFIVVGLRKKQTLKYRIGLLLLAFSILTVRYYYHIIALEVVLTLAGALMIVLGYALIRYFKVSRYGYGYHVVAMKQEERLAQVEAWVIGEGIGGGEAKPAEDGFGGGSSGGGGATGAF